jgi:hypothetical protein
VSIEKIKKQIEKLTPGDFGKKFSKVPPEKSIYTSPVNMVRP